MVHKIWARSWLGEAHPVCTAEAAQLFQLCWLALHALELPLHPAPLLPLMFCC